MKQTLTSRDAIKGFAVILSLVLAGCATVQPNSQLPLVRTEQTLTVALAAVDSFLSFEFRRRADVPKEVQDIAARVRSKAVGAFESANRLRIAYKVNRSAENEANLLTALSVVDALVGEVRVWVPKTQTVRVAGSAANRSSTAQSADIEPMKAEAESRPAQPRALTYSPDASAKAGAPVALTEQGPPARRGGRGELSYPPDTNQRVISSTLALEQEAESSRTVSTGSWVALVPVFVDLAREVYVMVNKARDAAKQNAEWDLAAEEAFAAKLSAIKTAAHWKP